MVGADGGTGWWRKSVRRKDRLEVFVLRILVFQALALR